jgi:hypothetical protein
MSFQHLSHAWLLPAVTIACLTGCEPTRLSIDSPSSMTANPSTLVRGIQYYSRQNAKYLGSDGSDSAGYRLIDCPTFSNILQNANGVIDKQAARELYDSSLPITIDNQQIQSDCQFIRDSSLVYKVEYPLYIFLDRNTGEISCIRERPGTNTRSPVEVIPSPRYGVIYPKIGSTPPDSRILIAQVHGHPPILDDRKRTVSCMSDTDILAAHCLQVPVYAIDAMSGNVGDPGHIHRANPDPKPGDPVQNTNIGETMGTPANPGSTIDIALDALRIWGKSKAPDFIGMGLWNKAILARLSSPAAHDIGTR